MTKSHSTYPPKISNPKSGGIISNIAPDSPFANVGFSLGYSILSINGYVLRDVIDWYWYSDGLSMLVEYQDRKGDKARVYVKRDIDQAWGIEFESCVFDKPLKCKNNCSFCFIKQLPDNMRKSLYLRDDDYRFSFISGTFVTLSNIGRKDEQRIIDQNISPLRFSLHAYNSHVRKKLIGSNAQHGMRVFLHLLDAGIQFYCQIVLCQGINSGSVLDETLEWAYQQPGIKAIAVVPAGYTKYLKDCDSYKLNSKAARELLAQLEPFQKKACNERGHSWVYASDEFYGKAYSHNVLEHLPPQSFYGQNPLFDDGIGLLRYFIDDWSVACKTDLVKNFQEIAQSRNVHCIMPFGLAMKHILCSLTDDKLKQYYFPFFVENNFFGGNVDVTGLITGADLLLAVQNILEENTVSFLNDKCMQDSTSTLLNDGCIQNTPSSLASECELQNSASKLDNKTQVDNAHISTLFLALPNVILNEDNMFLDDMSLQEFQKRVRIPVQVVSCNPCNFFQELTVFVSRL